MSAYSVVILSLVLSAVSARFVAIPLVQNYRVVEVEDVRPRYVRQSPYDQGAEPSERLVRQIPQQRTTLEALEAEESQRFERQAGGDSHEHVDYGAHTGHHGAFGWYADFPVHSN